MSAMPLSPSLHPFFLRQPRKTSRATGPAGRDALSHSEQHQGWEFHYSLAPVPARTAFAGSAQIHRQGERHCELPIFEPQCNALASIDLLREQCLAWVESRSASSGPSPCAD